MNATWGGGITTVICQIPIQNIIFRRFDSYVVLLYFLMPPAYYISFTTPMICDYRVTGLLIDAQLPDGFQQNPLNNGRLFTQKYATVSLPCHAAKVISRPVIHY